MGYVNEIMVEGHKPFYRYIGLGIFVSVNKQSQFKAGLLCDINNNIKMTENEAKEAREYNTENMGLETLYGVDYKYAEDKLRVNGFDLEKE